MKWIFFVLSFFSLTSCKKYIEYSPNDVRFDASEKNLNEKNIARLRPAPVDSFKFIVIGDTQRFYDELNDFVNAVNQRNDIAFIIINGDITDFGQAKEYEWINRELKKLKQPYIAVIGNHDMLANGRLAFQQMFGPDNFSFSYGNSKFICLNSCSREYGFNGRVPDLNWLQNQLTDLSGYASGFVISHVPPFHEDFDKNLSEKYNALLAQTNKVPLSIHGHTHQYADAWPYGKPVEYLVVASINKRHYSVVTVRNDKYEMQSMEY